MEGGPASRLPVLDLSLATEQQGDLPEPPSPHRRKEGGAAVPASSSSQGTKRDDGHCKLGPGPRLVRGRPASAGSWSEPVTAASLSRQRSTGEKH